MNLRSDSEAFCGASRALLGVGQWAGAGSADLLPQNADFENGKVRCVECVSFSLRASPKWADLGFGTCPARPGKFMSPSYPRDCKDHVAVAPEKATARIEWLRAERGEGR